VPRPSALHLAWSEPACQPPRSSPSLTPVPLVNFIAIPSLIGSVLLLVHTLPFATYLLLAQTDAPKHKGSLFLPFSPSRHLGILVAVSSYLRAVITLLPKFVYTVIRTAWKLWRMPPFDDGDELPDPAATGWWWERYASFGVEYQKPKRRGGACKLDVFRAQPSDWHSTPHTLSPDSASPPSTPRSSSSFVTLPDVDPGSRADLSDFPQHIWSEVPMGSPIEEEDSDLWPVVVFLYDVGMMGPVRPRRWMFGLTGLLLAKQGYVSVVPDITTYPTGQMADMVSDVRAALAWVHKEIRSYGGDPSRIYVCGHGLGAHLGMYTIAQDVVVHSRDKVELHNAAVNWASMGYHADQATAAGKEIPNGVRALRIYGPDIDLPPVKGVILLSPVADVIKQVRHEAKCWLEHVSPLRRSLGSSQTRCMRHSLGHILFAAKDIVDVDLLPRGALILHGKRNQLVPEWQGTWLAELLRGFDFEVTLRTYSRLGHFDVVTNLMAGFESRSTAFLLEEIRSFIESSN
jgi:acetyl esterase/lipase